uniref:Reverse transcriptase Ty1/copia-type domain-containing protein n=1 Tax=Medicago truncatula TaxID=3880 RepID=A2Q1C7_MEDTR|nr:hypothetical protein MtrDRAFT_AC148775g3v2 [Medicago truncatula]
MFKRRNKLNLLQKQLQWPKLEIRMYIWMDILPDFGLANGANKVCQLNMTLYGLEQSPHSWFGRFTKAMMCFGYNQNQRDHYLFFIHKEED